MSTRWGKSNSNLEPKALTFPVTPHFPKTVLFHHKASGKRDDVDNISSSSSDITDSSTESGDGYDSERERQLERE
jgi:hypothetical protein